MVVIHRKPSEAFSLLGRGGREKALVSSLAEEEQPLTQHAPGFLARGSGVLAASLPLPLQRRLLGHMLPRPEVKSDWGLGVRSCYSRLFI